jgi:hypothetical protein
MSSVSGRPSDSAPHRNVDPPIYACDIPSNTNHHDSQMNGIRSLIPPSPPSTETAAPEIGDASPLLPGLTAEKPAIVAFLRHIGCPFAEKTFQELRSFAETHGNEYQYIAVTHGTETDTNDYVEEIGGAGGITVISDPDREFHGKLVCLEYDRNDRVLGSRDGFIGLDGIVFRMSGP